MAVVKESTRENRNWVFFVVNPSQTGSIINARDMRVDVVRKRLITDARKPVTNVPHRDLRWKVERKEYCVN